MWPSVHPGVPLEMHREETRSPPPDFRATRPLTEISHQSRLLHQGLPPCLQHPADPGQGREQPHFPISQVYRETTATLMLSSSYH